MFYLKGFKPGGYFLKLHGLCAIISMGYLWPAYAWEGFVYADAGLGALEGFMQTPKGGSPGSSSFERPTLSEVDIHHNWFYGAGAGVTHHHYVLGVDYHFIKLNNSTTLKEDLFTQNQFIKAPNFYQMEMTYRWSAIYLAKQFFFKEEKWRIEPKISSDFLQSHYQLSAINAQADREFMHFAPGVGVTIERYFTPCFSTSLQVSTSIPFFNLNMTQAALRFNYTVLTSSFAFKPFLSMGVLRLDFEDNQTLPNHLHLLMRPFLTVGVSVS